LKDDIGNEAECGSNSDCPCFEPRGNIHGFLNAGAIRVSAWPAHCETAEEMGEQLERMAEALVR